MYIINIPKIKYQDPWQQTFDFRLNLLIRKNKIRVAYYYERPDSSTFRYRVYNMVQTLNELSTQYVASFFWGEEIENINIIIDNVDIIVICRSRYTNALGGFIATARNKGKKVFFDIDDLVFCPTYTHLVVDSLNHDLNNPMVADYWFSFIAKQAAVLNLCDEVIATNEYLASIIRNETRKKVSVIPNFLNREQLEISNQIYEEKKKNGFQRDYKFHIGYFSGSPTHTKDFVVLADALMDLLDKYDNLIFRIVGYMDLVKPLKKYSSRIERYSMQDFLNLQRLVSEVELNLVPLQDNEFTNCKSELKYFEAGVVGTVTIASPTFTYNNAISDGDNGFIANSYQWYEKIENLILNPQQLVQIAKHAKIDSESKFSWRNQIKLIENVLT